VQLSIPEGPKRIVCLTEEPTEILYALGEGERIVGISAYTLRPPVAKETKPVVSAFLHGSVDKIRALEPDLIIGFSDIQAKLASQLISANLPVVIFNQRSLQEILEVIVAIGSLVGRSTDAQALVAQYMTHIEDIQDRSAQLPHHPRVYFEEWNDPLICGIEWVSELIEIAGGRDVFAERAREKGAKERIVSIEDVVAANPEVMLASWCGAPFDREQVLSREGFSGVSAIENEQLHELPPEIILQPGPACLTDGLDAITSILHPAG